MKNNLLFIGSQNLGGVPDDGETMKNAFLCSVLSPYFNNIYKIDVRNRPKRLFYLIKLVLCLLFKRDAKIFLSSSSFVAYKLLKVFFALGWKGDKIYYWVVGGCFADYVSEGKLDVNVYKSLAKIVVQGESMRKKLISLGLENVLFLPNSKPIDYIPQKNKTNGIIKFVFLSRIIPEKGVNEILSAANKLRSKGNTNFIIDFYGRIEASYKKEFFQQVDSFTNVSYEGFLTLNKEGYDTLASYDCMLFPTYWVGEGFPGVIIDAYIAGLPVIATDWNLNKEIIKDGETGIIIPVRDIDILDSKMEDIISGRIDIERLSINSQKEAQKYDVNNVITEKLLKDIKLI